MSALRAFLLAHRLLAAGLLLATLAMKLAVPAGFMVGETGRVLTIRICQESSATQVVRRIVVPLAGDHGPAQERTADPQGKDACAFAGHAAPVLGGADPLLLAVALAFVLALGLAPRPGLPSRRSPRLRPPLRAPPALA